MAEEPKREIRYSNPRLLPWTEDGKACYLSSGSEGGFLSSVADAVEADQTREAREVLAHARLLLENERLGAHELRFVACRLAESLSDVLRVSESRGVRLGVEDPSVTDAVVELRDGSPEG